MVEDKQVGGCRRRPRWLAMRCVAAALSLLVTAWPGVVFAQTCVNTGSRATPPTAVCCNEEQYDCNSNYCLVSPSYTLDAQGNCCKPGSGFRD